MYNKPKYSGRLYKATFEGLPNDNRMFRAWSELKAWDRATAISLDGGYGNIRSIYEVTPRGMIVRNIMSITKSRRAQLCQVRI